MRLLSGCGLLSRALAVLSLLGVAASAVGLAPRPVVAQDLDRTGAIWGPYLEWSLANPSYEGNPYDLVADVTFRHPSGRAHTTEMFYQSGVTWKFRFTGTELGMWSFATSSSDPDLDGRSGTVTIGPNHDPGMKGFVASRFVDDDNGSRWIRTATGEAFIPQYVMYYLADDPAQIDAEIGTFIGEHGFTGFHIPVFCRWFDLGSPSCRTLPESSRAGSIEVARAALEEALRRGGLRLVRPGDAPPCASSGPNPDGRTFEILETIITKTYAAGGVVHLWMWGDEQRGQTPHTIGGLNGGPDRRLQRYVAARLGPLPGWTMGYGFDLDEWTSREDLRRWHAYMHDHLGWPHMLGGRSAGPNRGTDHRGQQIYDGLDYAAYEHHQPSYDVYVAALRHLPRIPAFSEDRFRIRLSGAYREKDFDHEMTRATMWDREWVRRLRQQGAAQDLQPLLRRALSARYGPRQRHHRRPRAPEREHPLPVPQTERRLGTPGPQRHGGPAAGRCGRREEALPRDRHRPARSPRPDLARPLRVGLGDRGGRLRRRGRLTSSGLNDLTAGSAAWVISGAGAALPHERQGLPRVCTNCIAARRPRRR